MPSRPTPPEHVTMPGKESDYSGVELEGMTGRMAEGRLLQALGERADLGISLAGELIAIDNSKGGGGLGEELGKGKRIKKAVTRLNLSVEVAPQTGEGSSAAPPPKAPQSWREAMALPDAAEWRKAAEEEMGMLSTLKVWEAVELPPGRKAISCRWVFTKKKQGETYSLYKARLVAKGYEQQRGDDYEETWAPTVSHVTVRCLLAVAVKRGYSIWQCDVKTAFLHGLLDKSNFLQQPEGFEDGTRRVWQLYKSLYGLKQSPRCWFQALREVLRAAGFRGSSADPALFLRGVGGVSLWVAVYVDDLLIVSAEEELCELTYKYLELHFTMKRDSPRAHVPGAAVAMGKCQENSCRASKGLQWQSGCPDSEGSRGSGRYSTGPGGRLEGGTEGGSSCDREGLQVAAWYTVLPLFQHPTRPHLLLQQTGSGDTFSGNSSGEATGACSRILHTELGLGIDVWVGG